MVERVSRETLSRVLRLPGRRHHSGSSLCMLRLIRLKMSDRVPTWMTSGCSRSHVVRRSTFFVAATSKALDTYAPCARPAVSLHLQDPEVTASPGALRRRPDDAYPAAPAVVPHLRDRPPWQSGPSSSVAISMSARPRLVRRRVFFGRSCCYPTGVHKPATPASD